MITNLALILLNLTRTVLLHQTDFSVVNFSKQLHCRIFSFLFMVVSITLSSKYRSFFLVDDPPPPFTPSLEIKPENKEIFAAPVRCQLSTRSLCKASSEEVPSSPCKTHPPFLYQSFPGSSCKSYQSSDSVCEIKCSNCLLYTSPSPRD